MEFSIFEGHIDYRRLDVYTSVTCCTYIIGIAARYFRKIFCFWRKNWMCAEERGAAGKSGAAGRKRQFIQQMNCLGMFLLYFKRIGNGGYKILSFVFQV